MNDRKYNYIIIFKIIIYKIINFVNNYFKNNNIIIFAIVHYYYNINCYRSLQL